MRNAKQKAKTPSSEKKSLIFYDILDQKSAAPGLRKGARTREKLKAAAARIMEREGYRDLRVSDVNETANVSNALFYVYFKNKQEICTEVLTEFVDTLLPAGNRSFGSGEPAIAAVYRGNLGYTKLFAANPGLMRCLIQLGDDVPEFGRIWRDWNDRWINRAIRGLVGQKDIIVRGDPQIVATVSALGVMVDGLLRSIYVDQNLTVLEAHEGMGGTAESLALFMTQLWHRVLFDAPMTWAP